jgi:hypothetical protein
MSRGADTIVFEACASAHLSAFTAAVGRLVLTAPPGAGLQAMLLLPAPAAGSEDGLAPFAAALTVLGVSVIHYDFDVGRPQFSISVHGAAPGDDLAATLIGD